MGRLGTVDPSSYSTPEKIITRHTELHWIVNFEEKKIKGTVIHTFEVIEDDIPTIFLDVSDLKIIDTSLVCRNVEVPVNFVVDGHVKDIGSRLTIDLPRGTATGRLHVRIRYETSTNASALQWLTPEQTLGKKHPYLFSQCQAIHCRSIMPCQDTPAVKFTYNARVEHPKELTTLMSAIRKETKECGKNSVSSFQQTIPIPAYLLAIAIGKLVSRPLGINSYVWAEEGIIEASLYEFAETRDYLAAAMDICGDYVWKQYDLLVMPPSFPFGGMENPCLTFVTPTLLAGDRSLADVVAHEIAHSWTGNLVTNRNFEHFWLNEGFTVFVEAKIIGRLKGNKERDFHSIRNLTDLAENIRTQLSDTPELTKLIVDLSNLGPDDAFSSVPYIKGSTFLRYLEDTLGGPDIFEGFLRHYLEKYAYKSVLTDDFKQTLNEYFTDSEYEEILSEIDWDTWLYGEGMPIILPEMNSSLANASKHLAELWSTKTVAELKEMPDISKKMSTHQLIDFLGKLIEHENIVELNADKIKLIEEVYGLNGTKNCELLLRFLRLCIRAKLMDRMEEILAFVNSNFRMKYNRPIYRDLACWPEAKPIAIENFNQVKNQMMAVCVNGVEKDLGLK